MKKSAEIIIINDFLRKISLLIACFLGLPILSAQQSFHIERLDPALDKIIASDASIEVLDTGHRWLEGPVWVKEGGFLLFSDVPANAIYQWTENEGVQLFLQPSGYTGKGIYSGEPGSNGLLINKDGKLLACEHGDRRISIMPLSEGGKRTLVDNYDGKRLNSPNDIIQQSNGDYYFTDPPYGLKQKKDDPNRELSYSGVYRQSNSGKLTLLIQDLTAPNGLAFSPDETALYVTQSDPDKAYIMSYPVLANGKIGKGKVFFDATPMVKAGLLGLPDGMKVDKRGNLFVAAPGGLLILNSEGKLLGKIIPAKGGKISNCAWGNDGSVLYITAGGFLLRIHTQTIGMGF